MPEICRPGRSRLIAADDESKRTAILDSAMNLIQRAALQPGGENFKLAVQKLNQYFEGTSPADYQLESAAREYLKTAIARPASSTSSQTETGSLRDTRHIEDCMMYYPIANRVAGTGTDLDSGSPGVRLGRCSRFSSFPPGRWRSAACPQALCPAVRRPASGHGYRVARRLGGTRLAVHRAVPPARDRRRLDHVHPEQLARTPVPRYGLNVELEASLFGLRRGGKLADRLDLRGARSTTRPTSSTLGWGWRSRARAGSGWRRSTQAMTDPAILERMNLPGESPYGTSRASLSGQPDQDRHPARFEPRLFLAQDEAASKRAGRQVPDDPLPRSRRTARALRPGSGRARRRNQALEPSVRGRERLFTDGQFVASIQRRCFYSRREFPLIYARVKQLRGDLDEAIKTMSRSGFAKMLRS